MRVIGAGFFFGGVAALGWAAFGLFNPVDVPPAETLTGSYSLDALLTGTLAAGMGLLVLTRRPYRPDLGDTMLSERTRRRLRTHGPDQMSPAGKHETERRNWWTGDPVPKDERGS